MHGPPDWSIFSTPIVATAASASKAAVPNQSHICTSISATLSTAATPQAAAAVLVLRDGPTATGTIIWSKQVILPANSVWEVNLTDLVIKGTAGNPMTLELVANPVAGAFASVAMTGYDSA